MISINNVILSTLVLSLAVTSIGCLSLGNSRIFLGDKAAVGQFPYQVAIHEAKFRAGFTYSCGGTILSEQFVLTAAQCITKAGKALPERFQVFAGALKLTDGQMYEVKKLYVHENFTEEQKPSGELIAVHNDIALIELKTPITFSETVSQIPLNRQFIPENVQTVLSGYGDTLRHTGKLNYIGMRTMSVARCNDNPIHSNTTLCALSVRGGGACNGDSGSPLTDKRTLVGIVSWGPVACYLDKPDGFTRVSLFIEWIEETMRNAIEN